MQTYDEVKKTSVYVKIYLFQDRTKIEKVKTPDARDFFPSDVSSIYNQARAWDPVYLQRETKDRSIPCHFLLVHQLSVMLQFRAQALIVKMCNKIRIGANTSV